MIFHSSIQCFMKRDCSIAPSMVQDGIRNKESKGAVPDDAWMKELKEAAATAFLGAYCNCWFDSSNESLILSTLTIAGSETVHACSVFTKILH